MSSFTFFIGRLNVLANVVRKPLAQIFHEFESGNTLPANDVWGASGDVKYHLGTSYKRPTLSGHHVCFLFFETGNDE